MLYSDTPELLPLVIVYWMILFSGMTTNEHVLYVLDLKAYSSQAVLNIQYDICYYHVLK